MTEARLRADKLRHAVAAEQAAWDHATDLKIFHLPERKPCPRWLVRPLQVLGCGVAITLALLWGVVVSSWDVRKDEFENLPECSIPPVDMAVCSEAIDRVLEYKKR